MLPPVDFESTASTDSAIPANGEYCNRKRRRLSSGTGEVRGASVLARRAPQAISSGRKTSSKRWGVRKPNFTQASFKDSPSLKASCAVLAAFS